MKQSNEVVELSYQPKDNYPQLRKLSDGKNKVRAELIIVVVTALGITSFVVAAAEYLSNPR